MNSVLYRGAGPLWTPGKPAAPSPLLTGLVSYWKLDEASTGAAPVTRNDSHSTNHLTDNNTVTSAAGKINNAASFAAASSEFLSHADNASLSLGVGVRWTFTGWLNVRSPITAATQSFLSKRNVSLEYAFRAAALTGTTYKLDMFVSSNGGGGGLVQWFTSGSTTADAWHFFAVWYDGVNLSGSVDNGTAATTPFSADVFDGTSIFALGAIGAGGEFLDGKMDEVGFWKRALTSGERTQLYNAGNGLAYPFN